MRPTRQPKKWTSRAGSAAADPGDQPHGDILFVYAKDEETAAEI
ncbi:hypothetical protein [Bradyrhizobium sp. Bra78]|nr:hypothetical protein [Bradyrhizobium sp. Bra78]